MSQFIETIRVFQKKLWYLPLHQQRMDSTRAVFFPNCQPILLNQAIQIPNELTEGLYKCRVTYAEQVLNVAFEPYTPKKITTLKLVDASHINYNYKFANRSAIHALSQNLPPHTDILMVKDGVITDTSYANVAFKKGDDWFTPSKPLLKGTMREHLLQKGIINEKEILRQEIKEFEGVRWFNAMLGWNHANQVSLVGQKRGFYLPIF